MLENTRFNPGETKNDPGVRTGARRRKRPLRPRRVRLGAPRARVDGRRRAAAAGLRRTAARTRARASSASCSATSSARSSSISGGAKVDDKLGVLQNLGGKADAVLVGGKMAEQIRTRIRSPFEVVLPVDVVAAATFAEDAETKVVPYDALPEGWLGLDIGPRDARALRRAHREGADDLLERPDGCLRVAAASPKGRKPSRRRSRPRDGLFRRRRRRLGAGADRARARRQGLVALDRRRSGARAARRQGPSRGAA